MMVRSSRQPRLSHVMASLRIYIFNGASDKLEKGDAKRRLASMYCPSQALALLLTQKKSRYDSDGLRWSK